ncbi:MAG: phosphoribosylformylglycinamidine cyclo-ligase [Candidatus Lindowbacteria bacterium RIFCSPLOWO2_12_FULL_62_27]|nr:MAG: phosphoribosylformylglycinamidine cyclo-ligase [Candidatus Lindowbacteria bacterium RIFCSPLOWO2_02_FULL_62_12]OGH59997.1 MAG: phosphoribosylformylglycinamidine cyclo-ligase [Candidatus Lindowbacteria bacterium RIFCSPLOWO2_12_FULL_62_27]
MAAYADAGVDAELAGRLIGRFIQKFPASPLLPKNYFCQLVRIPAAISSEDLYVALSTDGVGTKILLGIETGMCGGLGQDLVGMIYNDLITSGAQPSAFLDYYATGKLAPAVYRTILASIVDACNACAMPLLGGETAELPGLYARGHFDLAGFGIGWVKPADILSPERVRPGQILVGFPSSGFHSNGYSLIRKVLSRTSARLSERLSLSGRRRSLKEFLMEPTRLYTGVIEKIRIKQITVSSLAHITGGGYYENVPRAVPADCGIVLSRSAFDVESAELFRWFSRRANLSWEDMLHIFNCGFGLVAICEESALSAISAHFPGAVRLGGIERKTGAARVRLAA